MAGVLSELSKEFNIGKFLLVLLDSLIDCRLEFYDFPYGDFKLSSIKLVFHAHYDTCSSLDEYCQRALLSLIEKVPINECVHHVVIKTLSTCVKLSQKVGDSTSLMSGVYSDSES